MSNFFRRRSVVIGHCRRSKCGRRIILNTSVIVTLTKYEHAPHMNDFKVTCAGCNHKTRFFLTGLPFFDAQSWLYSNAKVVSVNQLAPSPKCIKAYRREFGLRSPMPAAGVDIDGTVNKFAAEIEPITIIAGLI